jgi:hypothetical protein
VSTRIEIASQLTRLAILSCVAELPTTPGDCDLCAAPGPLHAVEGHRLCAGCLRQRTIDTFDAIKALCEEVTL